VMKGVVVVVVVRMVARFGNGCGGSDVVLLDRRGGEVDIAWGSTSGVVASVFVGSGVETSVFVSGGVVASVLVANVLVSNGLVASVFVSNGFMCGVVGRSICNQWTCDRSSR
jgi:hypothetical protein